jgi:hypothetical protein
MIFTTGYLVAQAILALVTLVGIIIVFHER